MPFSSVPPSGRSLRAHRALQQLAERLAGAGFDVLRFDYFGCGDSSGEGHEGRLDRWLDDARAGIEEAEALCGSARVALVGVRLGAALAARGAGAAPTRGRAGALGAGRGRAAPPRRAAARARGVAARPRARGPRPSTAPDEVLGFTLPAALAADIDGLRLDGMSARSPDPGGRERRATESASGEGPSRGGMAGRAGPPVWRRDEGDGMAGALVPGRP